MSEHQCLVCSDCAEAVHERIRNGMKEAEARGKISAYVASFVEPLFVGFFSGVIASFIFIELVAS